MSAVSLVAVLALSGTALAACGSETTPGGGSHGDSASPALATASHDHAAQAGLQAAMRTLWIQHMEWTWSTVTAFAADLPSLQADLDRLLRNQRDIGDAIRPYYGGAAARQLTELLTVHINQSVPVLVAAQTGDKAALDRALDDWYANAQDIADFLADANPDNWPRATVRQLMKGHIDMTVEYAGAVLGGRSRAAVRKYDVAEEHMIHLADVLAQGIVFQFPDKF